MFLPFPIIAVIAGGTELGQGLTDYRSADPKDFLADGIGLAVGAIVALILDLRAAFRKVKQTN